MGERRGGEENGRGEREGKGGEERESGKEERERGKGKGRVQSQGTYKLIIFGIIKHPEPPMYQDPRSAGHPTEGFFEVLLFASNRRRSTLRKLKIMLGDPHCASV